MQLQELRPAHTGLPALRRGFQVVPAQDIAHRDLVDVMPQIRQGPLDASIAPGRILFGHADDELLDLLSDTRSAQRSPLLAPVKLLGDEALIPAQEGLGRHKRGELFQTLAPERVGQRRKAAAFGIGEAQPTPTEVGFEDAVFLKEVGDDLLLVPLEPAGDHGDKDMQDHRRSSRRKS